MQEISSWEWALWDGLICDVVHTQGGTQLGCNMGLGEEFCNSQSNKFRAQFDLLTSFRQGNRSINEWYNAVRAQVTLEKYPPGTAKILHIDIFWFFMRGVEFVSKMINEGSVDLDKFLASKVCHLAKKMESSKVTARHIKQIAGDPQAAQINLMWHQCTEIPNGKHKKREETYCQTKAISPQECWTSTIMPIQEEFWPKASTQE